MPPNSRAYTDDYARLGAPIDCDLDALKQHYRRAVRDLHPDRNPDLAADPAAQSALRELNAAFERLSDHHRVSGRLPLEPLRATPLPDAAPSPGRAKPFPWRPAFALSIVTLAVAWATLPPPAARAPAAINAATTSVAQPRFAADAAPVRDRVRIGDRKDAVRAILGPPILTTRELWEYGPSHVRFADGKVVDWYSSPLKPIRVDEGSRSAAGVAAD
jgi:hypothetical protein